VTDLERKGLANAGSKVRHMSLDAAAAFRSYKLEVIVIDECEARIAQSAGADRLELVSEMSRGGLSPSPATLDAVLKAVYVPIRAMVRPHDLGFGYDEIARRAILETVRGFYEIGARGFVFGALSKDRHVDRGLLTEFLQSAPVAEITFHRAFDACVNPEQAYADLSRFPNVTHVLSGGGARNALDGMPLLRRLIQRSTHPTVLVGGGVSSANVRDLIAATGAREIHVGAAARESGRIDGRKIERLVRLVKG
jgi:copper homeostasis protein